MTGDRKVMEGEIGIIKKDIEDLDLAFQKLEEKKMIGDTQAKAYDDLHVAEEKVGHLNDMKAKLEATFDEVEGGVAGEKRARSGVEAGRRKVEGELKMAQETVSELEGAKRDLENVIAKKEKDILGLSGKLDEELDAERQARAKAEKQRADLAKEMERIGDRLADAGGATAAQAELNKKREYEVGKLRKDLEEANIANESVLMSLKKKHQDAIQEMTEQVDCLSKAKSKIDKDKVK